MKQSFHPLFTSGTARGGTNLRAQILSAHKDICVASDPYLPLFREFRNAVLRKVGDPEILADFDPDSYLEDYYFSPTKLRVMKYVQQANLELPFDRERWPSVRNALAKRTALASADLLPYLDLLPGSSFLEIVNNGLALIQKARRSEDCQWIGFNDNWCVEFFAPLARAFPDARFIIHLRDPRGAIEGALHAHPEQHMIPHVISFARSWRKYVAFALEYRKHFLFHGRLHLSVFESIVLNPEKYVKEMTDFLGVEFDGSMCDINNFRLATGERWPATWEIYQSAVDLWERELPEPIIEVVEFICGPEMEQLGYTPVRYSDRSGLSAEALKFIEKDSRDCQGWRTDFKQLEKDVGFELFRRTLLSNQYTQLLNEEVIERCFLFKEVYHHLKNTCTGALAAHLQVL